MDCSELIKKVKLVINEAGDDGDVSLLSADTRSLDDTIAELLPRAVTFIQKNKGSGGGRVNTKAAAPSALTITADGEGGGTLLLPADFVALVSLQLAGWYTPVHHLYAHDSREAAWQRNEYTRAGCHRPVCVETFMSAGERCAQLFPLPSGNAGMPVHFVYETAFNVADGLQGYDEWMVDAVVYQCASMLYTVFERYDAANSMLALALAACGSQAGK